MISPSTPPGTKIVCINTDIIVVAGVKIYSDGLTLGAEYTLERVEPGIIYGRRYEDIAVAIIEEWVEYDATGTRQGHLCQRFRRRDLPESIARLQTALRQPVPALG